MRKDEPESLNLERDLGERLVRYQDLMRQRIHDVLLVSSLYDSFILGEDGQLYEMLLNEYIGLNLSHTPGLTRVSSGKEALRRLQSGHQRFDLIITTHHLEDMHVLDFAMQLREKQMHTPLVLLTYDSRELNDILEQEGSSYFTKVFMWQGNFNILLAIIKCIEDLLNVERDTRLVGVQSIILVEDNVKFYSSYLPIIYTELIKQSQRVIAEGINLAHKILRMRARPKILLCHTFEEAWDFYQKYHESILGVISDVRFPRKGKSDPMAGVDYARAVKQAHPDIPILLQSNDPHMEKSAYEVGASFLLKNSPVLLHRLQEFMVQYFSFGDFIFCLPDGTEVDRAADLRELRQKISTVPDESLLFHAERNHFSNWLKARTEFFLAHKLRPRRVSDYESVDQLRAALISYLREYQMTQKRGIIVDFDADNFDPEDSFARVGRGSLGGKGRGLAFARSLINTYQMRQKFKNVMLRIPPTVILSTEVFDEYIESNNLRDFAINTANDEKILSRFIEAELPEQVVQILTEFLKAAKYPLAVRSSSLLEDSQYLPFAGVYSTFMLPNNQEDFGLRLNELMAAIKRVYASIFSSHAKAYLKATPYRLEEEKMAVIIQRLVGRRHRDNFYPDFSGIARSHNFYPIKPMSSDDGIASVALGLGLFVVEGGATIRFCPKYPRHLVQFSAVKDALNYSQKHFLALSMNGPARLSDPTDEAGPVTLDLSDAERDGVLGLLASTYSRENNAIHEGISRSGPRIITFAPILKSKVFPLPEILNSILAMGKRGMSGPVEIEFSANFPEDRSMPREFFLLQMRPMVLHREKEELIIEELPQEKLLCRCRQVLGNGLVDDIEDIVMVDREKYERSESVRVARELARFNHELSLKDKPYLLIGVGRWGSADPWLGIPVVWDDISGATVIVESGFKDMKVTPSQGTHFFQNITAFGVGYFTVNSLGGTEFLDWDWLRSQKAAREQKFTRHIKLGSPLTIKMNGHSNEGVIIKPE